MLGGYDLCSTISVIKGLTSIVYTMQTKYLLKCLFHPISLPALFIH